jgi:DNA mismatch repair protein MutS2
MLADARRAADDLLARAEREVLDLRREMTRQRNIGRGGASPAARQALDELAGRAATARADASDVGAEPGARADEEAAGAGDRDTAPIQARPGLWGRSRTLGSTGRIVEVSGRTGRVTLETDDARVVVPSDDVEVIAEPRRGPVPADRAADELRRQAAARISTSIDLRGERVEDALQRLDAYLDQALLAGLDSVAVIHGAGTGALRRAIRDRLAEHPRVRSARGGRREEGGDGATIAEL